MPNTLKLKIDDDTLDIEADAPFDEHTVNIVKTWAERVTPSAPDDKNVAARINALRDQVKGSNDTLQSTVDQHSPASSPIALTGSQQE